MNAITNRLLELSFPEITLRDAIKEVCMNTPNPELAFEIIFKVERPALQPSPGKNTSTKYKDIVEVVYDKWYNKVTFFYTKELTFSGYFQEGVVKDQITPENMESLRIKGGDSSEPVNNYIRDIFTGKTEIKTETLKLEDFVS